MFQTCQRPTFVDYDIAATGRPPCCRQVLGTRFPPYGDIAEVAALRLSPLGPFMFLMQAASSWTEKTTRDSPTFLLAMCISATSNALAGRLEPAQKVRARTLESDPDLRASNLRDLASGGPSQFGQWSPQSRVSGVTIMLRGGCALNETGGSTHDTDDREGSN
jgi:hypothetical protein